MRKVFIESQQRVSRKGWNDMTKRLRNEKTVNKTHLSDQRTEVADKEQMMEKHIVGENGISYTLGADGLYYPDLVLPKGTDYRIGRYGRMRADYIKKHHHSMYLELLFTGKWNEYLHGVDEECYQRLELLVEQMKAGAGVTEKLKATDQMKWVGLMNNLKSCAEEIVLKELIYS